MKKIIMAGLNGYENMKYAAMKRGEDIHKSAASGAIARRRAKLVGKSSWFKAAPKQRTKPKNTSSRPAGQQWRQKRKTPVAVLFAPQSHQGLLAKRLKEQETHLSKLTGETIKVVERTGVTVKQMLVRSNNFLTVCKDEDCFLCRTRTRGGGGGGQGGEQHEGQKFSVKEWSIKMG